MPSLGVFTVNSTKENLMEVVRCVSPPVWPLQHAGNAEININ